MTEEKSVSVVFQNKLSEISRLGEVVEQFGSENNLSPAITNSVNLALDEIITNTISYGYKDEAEHQIRLNLKIEGNLLVAEIEDDGLPFNPLEKPDVDTNLPLEDKSVGGLGIHLVRKLMDEINYQFVNNKNILTIKKKIA